MPRPPSHFRQIDTHINDAYGALRERVRHSGYVPNAGNRPSSVDVYALGYIYEIAADHLPPEVVESEVRGDSVKSAVPLQRIVPNLVQKALDSGNLTAAQIVKLIEDRERFRKSADHRKANLGNRARGAERQRGNDV